MDTQANRKLRARRGSRSLGGDAAGGRSIDEVNLAAFQVEINAVRGRGGKTVVITPGLVLNAGDVLVLLGAPDQLNEAEQWLRQGHRGMES